MQDFMNKNWKWVKMAPKEQAVENRVWRQEEIVLDPIFSIMITECQKSVHDNNKTQLDKFSKYFKTSLDASTKEKREKIDCVTMTEKFFLDKFTAEYFSFYQCKNNCQWNSPRGVIDQIYRGKCYLECGRIFNNKLRAWSFNLQSKFLEGGWEKMGDIEILEVNIDDFSDLSK